MKIDFTKPAIHHINAITTYGKKTVSLILSIALCFYATTPSAVAQTTDNTYMDSSGSYTPVVAPNEVDQDYAPYDYSDMYADSFDDTPLIESPDTVEPFSFSASLYPDNDYQKISGFVNEEGVVSVTYNNATYSGNLIGDKVTINVDRAWVKSEVWTLSFTDNHLTSFGQEFEYKWGNGKNSSIASFNSDGQVTSRTSAYSNDTYNNFSQTDYGYKNGSMFYSKSTSNYESIDSYGGTTSSGSSEYYQFAENGKSIYLSRSESDSPNANPADGTFQGETEYYNASYNHEDEINLTRTYANVMGSPEMFEGLFALVDESNPLNTDLDALLNAIDGQLLTKNTYHYENNLDWQNQKFSILSQNVDGIFVDKFVRLQDGQTGYIVQGQADVLMQNVDSNDPKDILIRPYGQLEENFFGDGMNWSYNYGEGFGGEASSAGMIDANGDRAQSLGVGFVFYGWKQDADGNWIQKQIFVHDFEPFEYQGKIYQVVADSSGNISVVDYVEPNLIEEKREQMLTDIDLRISEVEQEIFNLKQEILVAEAAVEQQIEIFLQEVKASKSELTSLVAKLRDTLSEEGVTDETRSAIEKFLTLMQGYLGSDPNNAGTGIGVALEQQIEFYVNTLRAAATAQLKADLDSAAMFLEELNAHKGRIEKAKTMKELEDLEKVEFFRPQIIVDIAMAVDPRPELAEYIQKAEALLMTAREEIEAHQQQERIEAKRTELLNDVNLRIGEVHQEIFNLEQELLAAEAAVEQQIEIFLQEINGSKTELASLISKLEDAVNTEGVSDETRYTISNFLSMMQGYLGSDAGTANGVGVTLEQQIEMYVNTLRAGATAQLKADLNSAAMFLEELNAHKGRIEKAETMKELEDLEKVEFFRPQVIVDIAMAVNPLPALAKHIQKAESLLMTAREEIEAHQQQERIEAKRAELLNDVDLRIGEVHQEIFNLEQELLAAEAAVEQQIEIFLQEVKASKSELTSLVAKLRDTLSEEGVTDETRSAIEKFLTLMQGYLGSDPNNAGTGIGVALEQQIEFYVNTLRAGATAQLKADLDSAAMFLEELNAHKGRIEKAGTMKELEDLEKVEFFRPQIIVDIAMAVNPLPALAKHIQKAEGLLMTAREEINRTSLINEIEALLAEAPFGMDVISDVKDTITFVRNALNDHEVNKEAANTEMLTLFNHILELMGDDAATGSDLFKALTDRKADFEKAVQELNYFIQLGRGIAIENESIVDGVLNYINYLSDLLLQMEQGVATDVVRGLLNDRPSLPDGQLLEFNLDEAQVHFSAMNQVYEAMVVIKNEVIMHNDRTALLKRIDDLLAKAPFGLDVVDEVNKSAQDSRTLIQGFEDDKTARAAQALTLFNDVKNQISADTPDGEALLLRLNNAKTASDDAAAAISDLNNANLAVVAGNEDIAKKVRMYIFYLTGLRGELTAGADPGQVEALVDNHPLLPDGQLMDVSFGEIDALLLAMNQAYEAMVEIKNEIIDQNAEITAKINAFADQFNNFPDVNADGAVNLVDYDHVTEGFVFVLGHLNHVSDAAAQILDFNKDGALGAADFYGAQAAIQEIIDQNAEIAAKISAFADQFKNFPDVNADGVVDRIDYDQVTEGFAFVLDHLNHVSDAVAQILDFNKDGELGIADFYGAQAAIQEIIDQNAEIAAKINAFADQFKNFPDVNADGVVDRIDYDQVTEGFAFVLDHLNHVSDAVAQILDFNKDGELGIADFYGAQAAIQEIIDRNSELQMMLDYLAIIEDLSRTHLAIVQNDIAAVTNIQGVVNEMSLTGLLNELGIQGNEAEHFHNILTLFNFEQNYAGDIINGTNTLEQHFGHLFNYNPTAENPGLFVEWFQNLRDDYQVPGLIEVAIIQPYDMNGNGQIDFEEVKELYDIMMEMAGENPEPFFNENLAAHKEAIGQQVIALNKINAEFSALFERADIMNQINNIASAMQALPDINQDGKVDAEDISFVEQGFAFVFDNISNVSQMAASILDLNQDSQLDLDDMFMGVKIIEDAMQNSELQMMLDYLAIIEDLSRTHLAIVQNDIAAVTNIQGVVNEMSLIGLLNELGIQGNEAEHFQNILTLFNFEQNYAGDIINGTNTLEQNFGHLFNYNPTAENPGLFVEWFQNLRDDYQVPGLIEVAIIQPYDMNGNGQIDFEEVKELYDIMMEMAGENPEPFFNENLAAHKEAIGQQVVALNRINAEFSALFERADIMNQINNIASAMQALPDVNGDGEVNVTDIAFVEESFSFVLDNISNVSQMAASILDLNKDGQLDLDDMFMGVKIIEDAMNPGRAIIEAIRNTIQALINQSDYNSDFDLNSDGLLNPDDIAILENLAVIEAGDFEVIFNHLMTVIRERLNEDLINYYLSAFDTNSNGIIDGNDYFAVRSALIQDRQDMAMYDQNLMIVEKFVLFVNEHRTDDIYSGNSDFAYMLDFNFDDAVDDKDIGYVMDIFLHNSKDVIWEGVEIYHIVLNGLLSAIVQMEGTAAANALFDFNGDGVITKGGPLYQDGPYGDIRRAFMALTEGRSESFVTNAPEFENITLSENDSASFDAELYEGFATLAPVETALVLLDASGNEMPLPSFISVDHGLMDWPALITGISLSPEEGDAGVYKIRYKMQDWHGHSSHDFTITIEENSENESPTASEVQVEGDEDNLISGQAAGTDPEGDDLTYRLVSGDDQRISMNSDGSFIVTPDENFFGLMEFQYVVSDGKTESEPALIVVNIQPVNDAPEVIVNAESNMEIIAGENYTFNISGYDVDGDELTYSFEVKRDGQIVTPESAGIVFNPATQEVIWNPTSEHVGNYTAIFSAADATTMASVAIPFSIIDPAANKPPVVQEPQSIVDAEAHLTKANIYEVQIEAEDPEAGALTYEMVSYKRDGDDHIIPRGRFNVDRNSGLLSFSPIPADSGYHHEITVKVADAQGNSTLVTIQADVKERPLVASNYYGARDWLNARMAEGAEFAGLRRVYTRNEDGKHAYFNPAQFPQMSIYEYGIDMTDSAVMANASVCYRRDGCGSVERAAMETSYSAEARYRESVTNTRHWNPAHIDNYRNGYNPFPAKWNYSVSSNGSSGSEMEDERRFALVMLAFRPETQQKLIEEGMLMTVTDMILRQTRVADEEAYLTDPDAHPSWRPDDENVIAAMEMAQAMTPETIPARVSMGLVSSPEAEEGNNFFDPDESTILFNTPGSIASVWREGRIQGSERDDQKEFVIDLSESYDANGNALTYRVEPLDSAEFIRVEDLGNSKFKITFNYHGVQNYPDSDVWHSLASVGVFAHNGHYWSPPAFLSSFVLPNQSENTYDENGKIVEVSYGIGNTTYSSHVTSSSGLLSYAYPVENWESAMAMILSSEDTLANSLIQNEVSDEEKTDINTTNIEYQAGLVVKAELDAVKAEKAALRAEAQAAQTAAQEAYDADPSDENLAILNEAKAAFTEAHNVYKTAERAVNDHLAVLGNILLSERSASGLSARRIIENAMNAVVNNLDMYFEHKAEIDAMHAAAENSPKYHVTNFINNLKNLDIMAEDGNSYTSVIAGAQSTADFTNYEIYSIKRFNMTLLSKLLMPGTANYRAVGGEFYTSNDVAYPKDWQRDVYTADGSMVRYRGAERIKLNAEGEEVLENDANDRPVLVREMDYEISGTGSSGKVVMIRGDRLHYSYVDGERRLDIREALDSDGTTVLSRSYHIYDVNGNLAEIQIFNIVDGEEVFVGSLTVLEGGETGLITASNGTSFKVRLDDKYQIQLDYSTGNIWENILQISTAIGRVAAEAGMNSEDYVLHRINFSESPSEEPYQGYLGNLQIQVKHLTNDVYSWAYSWTDRAYDSELFPDYPSNRGFHIAVANSWPYTYHDYDMNGEYMGEHAHDHADRMKALNIAIAAFEAEYPGVEAARHEIHRYEAQESFGQGANGEEGKESDGYPWFEDHGLAAYKVTFYDNSENVIGSYEVQKRTTNNCESPAFCGNQDGLTSGAGEVFWRVIDEINHRIHDYDNSSNLKKTRVLYVDINGDITGLESRDAQGVLLSTVTVDGVMNSFYDLADVQIELANGEISDFTSINIHLLFAHLDSIE